ncbi:YLMG2 [Scenedesmus sp. PABB004]|nr:YLMG2 [Scenedesmus sp. PABB004]
MEAAPAPLVALQQAAGHLQRSIANAFGGAHHQPRRVLRPRLLAGRARAPPRRVGFGAPLAAIIPGDTVVEQVLTTGVSNFLSLYNTALVARLVLTWFPSPPEFIVGPLSTLCDPYLNLFRGIIPPLGGSLDFSPILAFVLLSVFTNTAAALPCELGPDGGDGGDAPDGAAAGAARRGAAPGAARRAPLDWLPMSRYQAAWAARVAGARGQRAQQAGGASA